MTSRLGFAAVLVALSALPGCAERPSEESTPPADPPAAQPVALVQADGAWGGVKGRIIFGGDQIPKRNEIQSVNLNPDKAHCLSKGPLLDENLVVNEKNKGLKWTFVWLAPDPATGKKDLPIHPKLQNVGGPVTIDQPLCMFSPHCVGIREGQELVVKNPAPMAHNFKYGGHPEFNPGANPLMPANTEISIKNLKAHRIPVKMECGIHPWMNGWIRIFDHPYFAVTDENGAFEIKDAPAGTWRMIVWHETGWLGGPPGKEGRPVTIEAGKTTDVGALAHTPPK